jgi:hypothetical protein
MTGSLLAEHISSTDFNSSGTLDKVSPRRTNAASGAPRSRFTMNALDIRMSR